MVKEVCRLHFLWLVYVLTAQALVLAKANDEHKPIFNAT
jgi:hypothetical protein